jgi:hypothetical protein
MIRKEVVDSPRGPEENYENSLLWQAVSRPIFEPEISGVQGRSDNFSAVTFGM